MPKLGLRAEKIRLLKIENKKRPFSREMGWPFKGGNYYLNYIT